MTVASTAASKVLMKAVKRVEWKVGMTEENKVAKRVSTMVF